MKEHGVSRFNKKDIVKDVVFFVIVTALAAGYWFLVFMLISFITLSYLHFTIETIYLLTIIGTVAVDIFYIVKTAQKYRKQHE